MELTIQPNPGTNVAAARNRVPHQGLPASFTAWFVPDLAMTLALLTLLAMFFLSGGATTLFGDSDTGWHIRIGERILSTGTLPRTDPYSFSKQGEPWIAWEWASDVLMGLVYRAAGLGGIALLFGVSIAVSVWMWFRLQRVLGGNFLLACLLFLPMLTAMKIHWLARPHVFSWLFLLGTVWLCERMPERPNWRLFALAALASAAWANIHASFFFGPLIALIYAAGAYVRPWIWDVQDSPRPLNGRNYGLLALTALIATLANPYGWQLHRHVLAYLANAGILDHIAEFQSFNFHDDDALQVILMLGVCFAGGFAALAIRHPARFFLSMLFIVIALRSVRALPVAALVLLPLANASLTRVISRASRLAPALRRRLDATIGFCGGLQSVDRRFHGFALVLPAALLVFLSIRDKAGFSAAQFPVAAAEVIATLPCDARIFAQDTFGSYLIFRFEGKRRVFFDGRSDFYGTAFLSRYARLIGIRSGWRGEFNSFRFSHVLLPPDSLLLRALEANHLEPNQWRELHRDRTAVLLAVGSPLL